MVNSTRPMKLYNTVRPMKLYNTVNKITKTVDDGIKELLGDKFDSSYTNFDNTTIFFPINLGHVVWAEDLEVLKKTFKAEKVCIDGDAHVHIVNIDKDQLDMILNLWRL